HSGPVLEGRSRVVAGGGASGGLGGGVAGAGSGGRILRSLGGLTTGASLTAIGGGLTAGALAGSVLLASGAISFAPRPTPPPPAREAVQAIVPCPGAGNVLQNVPAGRSLLVTARSGDGAWLQVYLPAPGIGRGWIATDKVHVDGDATTLPVA